MKKLENVMKRLEIRRKNTGKAREQIEFVLNKINESLGACEDLPNIMSLWFEIGHRDGYTEKYFIGIDYFGFGIYKDLSYNDHYEEMEIEEIYFNRDRFEKFCSCINSFLEKLNKIDAFEDLKIDINTEAV